MKILVTGGAGFIGSHVVDAYVAAGHAVVVVDNLSTGQRAQVNPRATFYPLDIRAPELQAVFEAERPEVVNHHAAQVSVERSVNDPRLDADINILGSLQLLQWSVKFGVRKFIQVSSGGAIYGEPLYLPCDEAHPLQPLSPYGASKAALELYVRLYQHLHHLNYSIVRYANVFGPRQSPHGEGGVIAIFAWQMLQQQPIAIYGSGEQTRDFIFVGDCAQANLALLTQGSGREYNFGSGHGTSINQVFATLQTITHYPHPAIYHPARAGEVFQTYLDTRRAQQELGWQPRVNLSGGLSSTVAFFKNISPNS